MRPTLKKSERVRKSGEFRRILKIGRRFRSQYLTLIASRKAAGPVRLGLTVSRKVGGAVIRNRVKRILREVTRVQRSSLSRSYDLVFIAQPGAGERSFADLQAEVMGLLVSLKRREESGEKPDARPDLRSSSAREPSTDAEVSRPQPRAISHG